MEPSTSRKDPKDKRILWWFIAFFGTFMVVDGIFAYKAITTQTGVITQHAYKRGLAYNETLHQARTQPDIIQKAHFEDDVLSWVLLQKNGTPLFDATVTAQIIRPVQDGYDFDVTLENTGNGIYKATLDLPLKGVWQAQLKSAWGDHLYQTQLEFLRR